MTKTPPIYKSDNGPTEFAVAVVIGGVSSATLSFLHVPWWASVSFALGVMVILAGLRFRAALGDKDGEGKYSKKDAQSLEAFAEDIYLFGYLLTLAALLGFAPRLMSDEANLFQIAGLKLVTTVVGLALMMIFRQLARRWAEEEQIGRADEFVQQQKLFTEAVARLNQGADDLTKKLTEVISKFDPTVLHPVTEWSNYAAAAFCAAANTLGAVPESLEKGVQSLARLTGDLDRAKSAAGELAGVLTAGTAQAANVLTTELGRTRDALGQFEVTVAALQPASENASQAIQKLGSQANIDAANLADIGKNFQGTVDELKKAERVLKKLFDLHTVDAETPLNRLVQALDNSSARMVTATDRSEAIQNNLREVISGIQTLTKQVDAQVVANRPDSVVGLRLVAQLGELRSEIGQTNEQIKTLVARLDTAVTHDNRPGFFSRFVGGGPR